MEPMEPSTIVQIIITAIFVVLAVGICWFATWNGKNNSSFDSDEMTEDEITRSIRSPGESRIYGTLSDATHLTVGYDQQQEDLSRMAGGINQHHD